MAKLAFALCVALVCLALASGWSINKRKGPGGKSGGGGGGGKSGGGKSGGGKSGGGQIGGGKSGGGSGGGSGSGSEEPAEPITKDEYKKLLQQFAKVFDDASDGLEKVELMSEKAHEDGENGDWKAVKTETVDVFENDLSQLGPAIEAFGDLLERIFASPEEFPPQPYCDSSAKLAASKPQINAALNESIEIAFIEDIGCFKDKLLVVNDIDFDAIDDPTFTEVSAVESFFRVMEDAVHLGKGFERFGGALEELHGMAHGGLEEPEKRGGSKLQDIARLLRELKFDTRRK